MIIVNGLIYNAAILEQFERSTLNGKRIIFELRRRDDVAILTHNVSIVFKGGSLLAIGYITHIADNNAFYRIPIRRHSLYTVNSLASISQQGYMGYVKMLRLTEL